MSSSSEHAPERPFSKEKKVHCQARVSRECASLGIGLRPPGPGASGSSIPRLGRGLAL